jgi:hypothetical protein
VFEKVGGFPDLHPSAAEAPISMETKPRRFTDLSTAIWGLLPEASEGERLICGIHSGVSVTPVHSANQHGHASCATEELNVV